MKKESELSSKDTVVVIIIVLAVFLIIDHFWYSQLSNMIGSQIENGKITPTMGLGALLFIFLHQYRNIGIGLLGFLSLLWVYMKITNKGGD